MAKSPVSDRMAKVESRLGKTTGASKGKKPVPKPKIKPKIGKGKVGINVTWGF